MGNKGIANIVSGGAGGAPGSAQDTACKAFGAAVDAYCEKKSDDDRATFSDFFFDALEKTKPGGSALAETIAGDETVTAAKPSESIAAAVARGTGDSAQAARRTLHAQAAASNVPQSPSLSAWSAQGAKWLDKDPDPQAPRFPAGKLENTAIEVKAPGDTYEPGKMEEYQSQSPDKKVVEVACESCGEDCAKGNGCC
jgi:hypothetical protein